MKQEIDRYVRKRIKCIRQFLESYMKSDNPEILHHLRVEIKKIKMLIGLLDFQNPKLDKQHAFKPFRKVFKLAGEIRDPILHRSLALELTGRPLMDNDANTENIRRFRKSIPKYIRVFKKREKRLLRETNAVVTKTFEKYLRQKRNKIKAILNRNYNNPELHSLRKLIKDSYYLESIIIQRKSIDPFFIDAARVIGDWHDKMMVIERLQKSSGGSYTDRINKIKRKSKADLDALKTLVRNFYAD